MRSQPLPPSRYRISPGAPWAGQPRCMSQTGRLVLSTLAILVGAILAYTKTISGDAWISLVVGIFLPSPFERRSAAPPGGAPAGGVLLLALCTAGACDRGLVVAVTPTLAPATAPAPRLLATSVTPITTLSAAGAGLPYSGESYDIACSVSGSVTLYPAVYDRNTSAWAVYQQYPCALAASVAVEGTCTFPARAGTNLLWNAYQTGGGSVSGCTAAGRQGPVPAGRSSGGSGGGSGTVTSVGLSLPAEFTVSGSPVTTSGTLTGAWADAAGGTVLARATGAAGAPSFQAITTALLPTGTGAGQVPTGGVITAGSCQSCDLTYNDAGQIVGASSGVTLFWDPVDQGEYKGWSGIGGNYVWGTGWQALKAITVSGVKARTQAVSGTLILSVWIGGVRVKTGSVTITAAGVYTTTFSPALAVTAGQLFTVSAYTAAGTIPYIDATQAEYEVTVAGPKVRLTNGRLYNTGDIEPTTTSGAYLFGASPVIQ